MSSVPTPRRIQVSNASALRCALALDQFSGRTIADRGQFDLIPVLRREQREAITALQRQHRDRGARWQVYIAHAHVANFGRCRIAAVVIVAAARPAGGRAGLKRL